MCGLAGFIGRQEFSSDSIEGMAYGMIDRLRHRGPDDCGVWVDDKMDVALAHSRLSILDLSAAGHQPMISSCGRYVMSFNGEIYNHLALRDEIDLVFGAYSWRGHSDTETLLEAFSNWGVEATLSKTNGMFAIALWDRAARLLTLARDRLGEKPLYYGWCNKVFLFGSELKALKAYPDFDAEINGGSLQLFLMHNCVPAPHSIYKDVYKLEPGTYAQLPADNPVLGRFEVKKYWSLADVAMRSQENYFGGTEDEAINILDSKLRSAVGRQMLSDVPVGAMLSGGLDSSLISALMQLNSDRPVRTFTIGFEESSHDESIHASAIARHLGTDHTELRLTGSDALSLVPNLPLVYDEPFADSSQLPTFLVMKLAREHVTVALSGDGADELFGGYKGRYIDAPNKWNYLSRIPLPLRRLVGMGLEVSTNEKLAEFGHRLLHANDLDDWWMHLSSNYKAQGLIKGANTASSILTNRIQWPRINHPLTRIMALDAMTYLPDDILVKVDRSAMAISLETRAPFLDKDVVEFACSLPMDFKVRGEQGKWIMHQVIDRYVPRSLIDRPKMGFAIPLDAWLRGPLREWAESLLRESRLEQEGYFYPAKIRQQWDRFLANKSINGSQLWAVLMFQSWLEQQ